MATGITSNHNKNLGNGQTGNLIHNNREINPKNVDPRLIKNNIVFKSRTLAAVYEESFGDAIDEYNLKQKRSDRRKYDRKGYFKHLFRVDPENESAQVILTSTARGKHEIKSFNEELFQLGDCQEYGHFMRDEYGNFIDKDGNPVKWDTKDRTYYDVNGNEVTDSSNLMPNPEAERAKEILTCFYEGGRFKSATDKNGRPCLERLDDNSAETEDVYIPPFEERNPSFKVVYAAIHNDEWHGTPHIHIDYVPVGSGYTKGPEKQLGFERALADMGFVNKNVAYKQWRNKEREIFKTICNCFGIETKTREEEQANNRGKTYTTKEYSDIIRDAKVEAQEMLKEAEQQAQDTIENATKKAQEIIAGAEAILNMAKEDARKITEQAENEAENIQNAAREEAENIKSAAVQEAANIVDEAVTKNAELNAENKALAKENEQLDNDIREKHNQIVILTGIIAKMPKKKFNLFSGTEKYEMDKSAYDEFMSTADTVKRLSGNTLTSDEDKAAIEEKLRRIEQLEADKEQRINEQAEQRARQMVQKAVEELKAKQDRYYHLIDNEEKYIKVEADKLAMRIAEDYSKMDKKDRIRALDRYRAVMLNERKVNNEFEIEFE